MDKGCVNCSHWMEGYGVARDFCDILPQREVMEFMHCSPLERKLVRLTERLGIKSCKYFEPKNRS